MQNIQRYWKAIVALIGNLAAVAVALNIHTGFAGKLSAWIIAVATALGVAAVPYIAKKQQPPLRGGGPRIGPTPPPPGPA
jgi:hypothetical protein